MTVPASAGGPAILLCDDSAVARAAYARVLEAEGCRVVARCGDGAQALAALERLPPAEQPDVVLLDLEMPVMDGMTVLPKLLARPRPPAVIVASAISQRGAAGAMAALAAGASDFIPKPSAAAGGLADPAFRAELVAKVRGWARMRGGSGAGRPVAAAPARAKLGALTAPRIVGIGCSTGGPQALATLLRRVRQPLGMPVLVVQHMPRGFTGMMAGHLDRVGALRCAEARDGEALRAGRLYVAPGERHLLAEATPDGPVARLSDAPPEQYCRPAVDPLFRSLAVGWGAGVLALVLTGMGQDGLAGSRAIAAAGGAVLVQDEASSVVWGMPGAVARAGLARDVLPPEALGDVLAGLTTPALRGAAA